MFKSEERFIRITSIKSFLAVVGKTRVVIEWAAYEAQTEGCAFESRQKLRLGPRVKSRYQVED